jgi:hypothetical protein
VPGNLRRVVLGERVGTLVYWNELSTLVSLAEA